MYKKIEELFLNNKFDLSVFYFKERGLVSASDLLSFDFDELMLVPGISEEIIFEIKEIYQDYLNSKAVLVDRSESKTFQTASEVAFTSVELKTDIVKVKGETQFETLKFPSNNIDAASTVLSDYVNKVNIKVNNTSSSDYRIGDIYKGIPRSAPFVNYCCKHGKIFVNQLSHKDFEDAVNIKGLGSNTIQDLYSIYKEHLLPQSVEMSSERMYSDKTLKRISVEEVFKSLNTGQMFINHCKEIGINSIFDLKNDTLAAAQLNGVNSLYIDKIINNYLELNNYADIIEKIIEGIELIPKENMNLSVKYLSKAGITQLEIQELVDYNFIKVKDICDKTIPNGLYSIINKSVAFLRIPFKSSFIDKLNNLKDTWRISLVRKCQGDTLQKIGDELGYTREGVRQIVDKSCRNLMHSAEILAEGIMADKNFFTYQDLQDLFEDSVTADCCKCVLTLSDKLVYLNFSDKL